MKTQNTEGAVTAGLLPKRYQILLADLARTAHHLPLRDGIHRIDVIHTLGSVPVALMYRVHAQEPRTILRLWPTAFADQHRIGTRPFEHSNVLAVAQTAS